jgi:uncharacterized heparinase superfamily protein
MRRLRTTLLSMMYTRPAQLAWRARFVAERFASPLGTGHRRRALRRRVERLAPTPATWDPPRPLPARDGMFRREGEGIVLRLLNHELRFQGGIDWRVAQDGGASQLWGFNLHSHEFLEEAGNADFQAIVADWIRSNPPYAPRYWHDAWSSYALSLRVVVWMQQLGRRRAELGPGFVAEARGSLALQLIFLESHLEHDLRGNHLIKNLKALLHGSRFFDSAESARWRDRASGLLARELDEQVLADGFHFERSPSYHAQVFADLLECHHVLAEGPLKSLLKTRLEAMAQVLADMTHPDGGTSLFNDGGLHMAYAPAVLLAAWSRISGQAPAPRREVRFDAAGYFGLRDGGDLVLIDAGRIAPDFLPGHGHGDILAFEWTVGGRRFAVDTGVFEYAPGGKRDRARATASHNTVTVDGADQCEFYRSFRVGRRAGVTVESLALVDGAVSLTASHDGFRRLPGGGVHRRTFRGRAAGFAIDDVIEGKRGIAEAWVVLHPDVTVTIEGKRAVLASGGVVAELVASGPIEATPWDWWPDFGTAVATTRLRVSYGAVPARGRLEFRVVARPA